MPFWFFWFYKTCVFIFNVLATVPAANNMIPITMLVAKIWESRDIAINKSSQVIGQVYWKTWKVGQTYLEERKWFLRLSSVNIQKLHAHVFFSTILTLCTFHSFMVIVLVVQIKQINLFVFFSDCLAAALDCCFHSWQHLNNCLSQDIFMITLRKWLDTVIFL